MNLDKMERETLTFNEGALTIVHDLDSNTNLYVPTTSLEEEFMANQELINAEPITLRGWHWKWRPRCRMFGSGKGVLIGLIPASQ